MRQRGDGVVRGSVPEKRSAMAYVVRATALLTQKLGARVIDLDLIADRGTGRSI